MLNTSRVNHRAIFAPLRTPLAARVAVNRAKDLPHDRLTQDSQAPRTFIERTAEFQAFTNACRQIGNDEAAFLKVVRVWLRQSARQREQWYPRLEMIALDNRARLRALGLRKERMDLLEHATPTELFILRSFRRFLNKGRSVKRSTFSCYLNAAFSGRSTLFPKRDHMISLLEDYPEHEHLQIAMGRQIRGFPPELYQEIRTLLRNVGSYAVVRALVDSSIHLEINDAARDLRKTSEHIQSHDVFTHEQRRELFGQIAVTSQALYHNAPSFPTYLVYIAALRHMLAMHTRCKPPESITASELEDAIAIQERVNDS